MLKSDNLGIFYKMSCPVRAPRLNALLIKLLISVLCTLFVWLSHFLFPLLIFAYLLTS